jgi:hypothetical protein
MCLCLAACRAAAVRVRDEQGRERVQDDECEEQDECPTLHGHLLSRRRL